jgi:hypothetical protein
MEGEMTRKNLNDVIHGDRALVRGYRAQPAKFDDWKYGQDAEPYDASRTATTYYSGSKTSAPSCYHSHPALKLPGTELVIYGGSCHHPVVTDADVYIGFDAGMMVSERNRPWNPGGEVTHVLFKISDMSVPTEAKEFVKLVDWAKAQLEAGKTVHCGCVGGHGRTGMFLSALVSRFGEPDAIEYVRKNYCKKVVESRSQVDFLVKYFGVKPASAHKGFDDGHSSTKKTSGSTSKSKALTGVKETFSPIGNKGCVWG